MKALAQLFLFSLVITCQAQNISRQSLASGTGGSSQNGFIIRQTIGQPYQTQTTSSDGIAMRPGFQQPYFDAFLTFSTLQVRILPNPAIMSFIIESSDTLHQATITVLDEAGRTILCRQSDIFLREEIFCAHWANGLFIVLVEDQKKNHISARLIKHQ